LRCRGTFFLDAHLADGKSVAVQHCSGAKETLYLLAKPPRNNKKNEKKENKKMAEITELSEKIAAIKSEIQDELSKIENSKSVYEYKKTILDKKTGRIGALMKQMGKIPNEQRADYGKKVNELKEWAQAHLEELDAKLKAEELRLRYESEKIDVTMPAIQHKKGNLHPVTQVRNQLVDIFASMGFDIYEGTEIETDYYNFTALNTPQDHPARDMQDTFYLSPEFLLRTQTSAGQIHVMEAQKPPIKVVSPGKVFRSDDDATHSPMFTQMEGLVVDKGITLCDLKGMLDEFVQKIFGEGTTTRLRPSYFPFTEPSVEVDVSCFQCKGKGCKLCKGTGWIEVLGAGVVNNKVLEGCGIDTNEYSGFAFGIGIERVAMLKYGINNIKQLFESDLRVLEQIDD
jgi:phenylalanyl-tRNA synthetase alpha chain